MINSFEIRRAIKKHEKEVYLSLEEERLKMIEVINIHFAKLAKNLQFFSSRRKITKKQPYIFQKEAS